MITKEQIKVMISAEEIAKRVKEMGAEITKDYAKFDGNILLICILKGSVLFFADLIREIPLDVKIDFMALSSYGNEKSTSGEVKCNKDLDDPIDGKHVIIVEDIIDSGVTLEYLKRMLNSRKPASLSLCALLDKPSRRKTPIKGEYIGFEIEDRYVVGYGLDSAQHFRNLKNICEVLG